MIINEKEITVIQLMSPSHPFSASIPAEAVE